MLTHVSFITLLLALLPHQGYSFFWKNRLIYSTIDPEPTWDQEWLKKCASEKAYMKDVSEGRIIDPDLTTSVSQKIWLMKCRDDYINEATDYSVLKERLMDYAGNVFGQIFNIMGHKYQKHRLQFINAKDWLTAKIFLRDPKAIENMMNNVNMNWFYLRGDNEYLTERWKMLWEDMKFNLDMSKRMLKKYNERHFPDGWLRTHINNFLGIKNVLLEEVKKHTTVSTTKKAKVYDEHFVENYMRKDQSDKKRKK